MSTKKALIFGNNAAALITGLQLEKLGYSVQVHDPAQHFQYENPRFFAPEISFWPSSEESFENLAWLEQVMTSANRRFQLGGVEVDRPPLAFDGNTVTEFIGFGDKTYSSIPAASVFNRRAELQLNLSERQIYQALREACTFEILEYSDISQIRFGGDGIESVQVNGTKDLTADLFVFCQTPNELIKLAPNDFFPARLLSRLARTAVYAQLSLDVPLDQAAMSELQKLNVFGPITFLMPAQNDHEPVLGQITDNADAANPTGRALWHSYIASEYAEDPEKISGQFRHMRKLIEKHLPVLTESLRQSTIHMQAEALSDYATNEALDVFKKSNNNAILASPLWSSQYGLAGAVEASRKAIAMIQADQVVGLTPTSLQTQI